MKIVAINGSPRGMAGNTGRLLDEVLRGVQDAGGEIEVICLRDLQVQPCVACDACHRTGICTIADDYGMIRDKLLAGDGFIFASPNYIYSVTAQMKALFDRCNGLIHCMALEGKYAAIVETSGGGDDAAVITYMEGVANALGAWSVGGIGSPQAGWRTFPDEDTLFQRAQTLGVDLCRNIAAKGAFPEQDRFLAGFRLRMSGLVAFMQDHWTYERDFWKQKAATVVKQ